MASGDSTLSYLDAYCERAGDAAFWAEPLNAVTNFAFIIAAIACGHLLIKYQAVRWRLADIWALVVLLFAIGVGSGLWHTHATQHTMWADVIPILLFMNLYLIVALRRIFSLKWIWVIACWLGFQAANFASEMYLPRDFMNGSVMYLPTYATLLIMTFAAYRHHRAAGRVFELAMMVFTASLFFRTVDMEFCEIVPFGTHFLWHCLNAYLLYSLLGLLIAREKPQAM